MKSLYRQQLGKKGENIASNYLRNKGYQVIDRNFKGRYGELDIIAIKNHKLIFVEVKTRVDESFGKPEEAVTPRKLREVIQTAQYFKLLHQELPDAMQIDVIGIELNPDDTFKYFKHIENVTL